MTDDAQRWKEKYLKSIEDQEKLERRWNARFDLLRLGLVRSTLAAEGADKAVDECMKEMRDAVRSDNMDAALANLIPRLEKTVLASEQRRESRLEQINSAVAALVNQLQALPLPRGAAKPLKQFGSGLDKRLDQARDLPMVLSELSVLQGSALAALDSALEPPRPGLLERWFKPREGAIANAVGAQVEPERVTPPLPLATQALYPANDEPGLEEQPASTIMQAPLDHHPEGPWPAVAVPLLQALASGAQAPITGTITVLPTQLETVALLAFSSATSLVPLDTLPLPFAIAEIITDSAQGEADTFGLPASPEPTYSSVAAHIESTLLKMLDDLALPQRLLETAESMRQRLDHGLNWYELLPLLDDLAAMVLAISDNGQQELQRYLQAINERLTWFQEQLQQASLGQAVTQDEARQLDTELREQVGGLHQSVAATDDADGLKRLVESRLDGLLGSMDAHRKRREAHEEAAAEQMRGLAERVASMEVEAEAYRNVLEEQRQKALLDTLTGLPNRAAWNERLEGLAVQRQADECPAQVAIMDLDHFKAINDNYGHLAGDRVLKIVADQLRRQLRDGDFLARFGGEEFVALFPGAEPTSAYEVLENMRQAIEGCPFHFKGERIVVTVSIGMTEVSVREQAQAALKRADQALYRAKDTGRNRIESA